MANDDNKSFPKPPSFSANPTTDHKDEDLNFEATPDNIPSPFESSTPTPTDTTETDESSTPPIPPMPITPTSTPEPIDNTPKPATLPASAAKPAVSPLLILILLALAGVGIVSSIFLYSQSAVLRRQLADISQTLEQQRTTITPTPTPTIIEIPSPTPTASPTATPVLTATPTPTASMSASGTIIPFSLSPQALKIGLNHEPNAQLLLIKIDNAQDQDNFLIKYFFRKDLTTKKYFYVTIDGNNESEIKTSAVYVNPDNNIPSLNDQVLGNKMGIDFPEAYKIATDLCNKDFSELNCKELPATAQFIQSGSTNIWQITLTTQTKKIVYQLNSKTKEVLFKPAD